MKGIDEWGLRGSWDRLNSRTVLIFKKKVKRIAKKYWPYNVPKDGMYSWIYHNHQFFSGNVPAWADWQWPCIENDEIGRYKMHLYYLLVGKHPAGGINAVCLRAECFGNNRDLIYRHQFFSCDASERNWDFFCCWARRLYSESKVCETSQVPLHILDDVLAKPSQMWFGLMDAKIFAQGLKIGVLHELHRILVIASVLSWGRFYSIPITET